MKRWLLIVTLLITLINCQSDNSATPILGQVVAGTWLLTEQGYSPGSGYFINKVPAQPQQTIVFTADGRMQAQGNDLQTYQAYARFRLDITDKAVKIHYAPNASDYSEWVYINRDTLKLYQSCFEGCHLGFVRIK